MNPAQVIINKLIPVISAFNKWVSPRRFCTPIAAILLLLFAITTSSGTVLAAAGDLDPSFGGDGKVTTAIFSAAQSSATIYAIATRPDGKIVVAGSASPPTFNDSPAFDFSLARYNSDGSLDTTFSGDGKLTTDIAGGQDYAYAVVVQADGKILAAGSSNINAANSLNHFTLVRYNANGSLDTSFGNGGIVTTDIPSNNNSELLSLALQADGKIVAGGRAHNDGVTNRFALARYNVNGSLDSTFGVSGIVTTVFYGFDDSISALGLQADGKIVAAGQAYPGGANTQFALARYNIDGSLDASFGAGGMVTTDFYGGNDFCRSVKLFADGKILAAGSAYPQGSGTDQVALARYNADGSLDASFGIGGKTSAEFSSAFVRRWSAAAQTDGKVIATSWGVDSLSGFDHFLLARFDATGNLDSTFSSDGKLTTTFFGSQNQAFAIAIQLDGKVVAAGSAFDTNTSISQFALARYETSDNPVPSVMLLSLSLNPNSVVGGNSSIGTVTLSAAAPAGGVVVSLSDNSALSSVPTTVTVPAGSTSADFTVNTSATTTSATATISATFSGVTRAATLTLNPAALPTPAAPALVFPAATATVAQPVAFDWSDVPNAVSYEIQIDNTSTIAAPFITSQAVNISQVTIGSLPSQRLWWRVRAQNAAGVFGLFSAARRFTPQAAPTTATLSAVTVNPTSVTGGATAQGTVTLTSAAPTGGVVVSLSINATSATVPANVTVPAGASSAGFTVTTSAVTASTTATISAALAGVTRTAVLTINPIATGMNLTVTASGRTGVQVLSNPAGINVAVGSTQSASFASNSVVTLSVSNNRDAIWSGACSSGGNKARSCTFTITGNASLTANVQ